MAIPHYLALVASTVRRERCDQLRGEGGGDGQEGGGGGEWATLLFRRFDLALHYYMLDVGDLRQILR